jgi:hypothetical protein
MPKAKAAAEPQAAPVEKKMTLYDVAIEGMQLEDALIAAEGELTPELEERLDRLMQEGPDRVEAAAMVVRNLEAFEEQCKAEARRLSERAKAFENNIERVKDRILAAVDGAFSGKVKTAKFTIWSQKAADRVAYDLREEFSLEMLKEEYPELVRTKLELDKKACADLYDGGMELPESIFRDETIGKRFIRIK